jgi:hypothetical protein
MSVPFFSRERIVATPGWSRWLVPPAALSIHLSIGAAPSWSVFKKPLEGALGISGTLSALPFIIGIVVLGLSAAVFGTWVDRSGPRMAMFAAMCCSCGGWLVGSAGLAVMGFGGGALIASPWSTAMLGFFGTDSSGIAKTFLVHGLAYAVFMSLGWLLVRVPRPDWKPRTSTAEATVAGSIVAGGRVSAKNAIKTPQFDVAVGCLVLARDCGYRHPGEGLADLSGLLPCAGYGRSGGRLRRNAVAGEHAGTHRLVEPVRQDRPEERLPDVPRRRCPALPGHHVEDELEQGRIPDLHAADLVLLRRRVRNGPGPFARFVRRLRLG